jgi:asparagine synthase (glutamine-hydrolysing)
MCGIAGLLAGSGQRADRDLLDRMVASVGHRGPDDRGVFVDGPVGLAHARLSIVDLEGGHQPLCNEDGTIWITFNGEIFNYIELRHELEAKGHRFATKSDTEVIVHLYEETGDACVHALNGQWAFALWDARRRRLFLSRDRLGVRPLHYAVADRTFLFASEAKSLLLHPALPRRLDARALDQIFTFWCPLPPRTIFDRISELPPAHSLIVQDDRVDLRRYWQPSYAWHADGTSESAYAERLLALLVDATRLRLRSDVPVGAYLSGGLDSSVVATLVRRFTDTPLRTFSVAFEDPEFDESRYQHQVSDALGTEHTSVRCSTSLIADAFPAVVWHAERPVLRTAPAPLLLLSRLVREHGFKVVLTGEGADEMLGGYDIFKETKIRRFWSAQPGSRLRPLLLRRLYPYLKGVQAQSPAYLQAFFQVRPEDRDDPFFSHLPRWNLTARLKRFYSPDVRDTLAGYDALEELRGQLPAEFARWDDFSRAQYLETAYLLPGYILSSQGDRVAMAHAVETRFPFLDHRLVEFATALPPRMKMRVLDEKHILKRAAGHLVPPEVRQRPKQPYRAPDASCFLGPDGPAREYVRDLLSPGGIRRVGLFDPDAVARLVAKVRSGHAIGAKDNMAVVGILSAQLLADLFLERFSGETPWLISSATSEPSSWRTSSSVKTTA